MFRYNDCENIPFFDISPKVVVNLCDKVAIDNYDSQEFNINDNGWIRNDISQLARAQSKAEFDAIMSRLNVVNQGKGFPADISLEDAIASIKPRWCQSPNEIEQFAAYTNPDVMAKLNEAYEKSIAVSEPSVSEPSSSSSE